MERIKMLTNYDQINQQTNDYIKTWVYKLKYRQTLKQGDRNGSTRELINTQAYGLKTLKHEQVN